MQIKCQNPDCRASCYFYRYSEFDNYCPECHISYDEYVNRDVLNEAVVLDWERIRYLGIRSIILLILMLLPIFLLRNGSDIFVYILGFVCASSFLGLALEKRANRFFPPSNLPSYLKFD